MADTIKERLDYEKYTPILADVNNYFSDMGFQGDENTRMGISVGTIRRKQLGIISGSGTGKSAVADILMSLFKPHQVYMMGAGSDKAQAYSADVINNSQLLYLTEIQKAGNGDVVIEMLKDLGEGKDYVRKVTLPGGEVGTQSIKKGKAIVFTKAIENKYETDDELDRRYPKFVTDMTMQQNIRVVAAKASKRSNPNKPHALDETQTNSLKFHMSQLLKDDANKYIFINPMADWLSKFIPTTFAVSRSYVDHYMDFIEGVAFFNKRNRIVADIEINGEKKKAVIVAPEDCWQLHKIYSEQFLQDVLNIPPNGFHIFNVFKNAKKKGVKSSAVKSSFMVNKEDDNRTKLTIEQIFNLLKENGIVLKETVINKMLLDLMMSGYIREDSSLNGAKKITEYYLTNEIDNFQNNLKWHEGIQEGIKNIEKNFPNLKELYVSSYCNKKFSDPFTGDLVDVNTTSKQEKPLVVNENRDLWND